MSGAQLQAGEIAWMEMGVADAATLKAYAEAAEDPNPIHQDEERAQAMGLPGVIAHGMLSAGWLAERARRHLAQAAPGAKFRWISMRTRFKDMTLRGERVECGGKVTASASEPGRFTLDLTARTSGGKVTTDCRIEVRAG